MSLRLKVIGIILAIMIVLTGILYWISAGVVLRGFSLMEEKAVQRNINLSQKAIQDYLTDLDRKVNDWGPWDETYQFIQDFNPDYIDGNLNDPTVANLDLNFMLYLDVSGRLVYAKGLDLVNQEEAPVPSSLEEYLAEHSSVFVFSDVNEQRSGIIGLPEGILLVAARPILPSIAQGEVLGSLVFGRYIDEGLVDRFRLGLDSVDIYAIQDLDRLPPDVRQYRSSLTAPDEIIVAPLSDDSHAGYALLSDLTGEPVAMIRGTIPRELYQQGKVVLQYLLFILGGVSLAFAALSWGLLDRLFLSRLMLLSRQIHQVGFSQDLSLQVQVKGKDELSHLAEHIDSTFQVLHQSQQALSESEEKYRDLVESSTDWVWEVDENNQFRYSNPSIKDILGYTAEELIGKTPFEFMTPEDIDRINPEVAPLFQNLQAFSMLEMCLTHLSGNPVRMEVSGSPILSSAGEYLGYRGIGRDISDHWQVENALRESESKYRALFNSLPDAIFIIDKGTHQFLDCNQAVQDIYGYSVEELRAMTPSDLYPLTDLERTRPILQLINPGVPIQSAHLTKAGRKIEVEIISNEIVYQNNPAWINIVRDTTERKTIEDALKIEQDIVQSIFNSSPAAITVIDLHGKIIDCNQALLDMFGRSSKAGVIGDDLFDSLVQSDQPRAREALVETIRQGLLRNIEFQCVKHGGFVFTTESSASIIRDAEGKPRFILILSEDITERKRAEKIRSVIYLIAQATHSTPSLDDLYQSIYSILNEVIPAKNLFIALYDQARDELTFPFFADEFDEAPSPKKPGKGLTEYVLRTGKPLMAAPHDFEELVVRGEVESIGTPSLDWLGVPLITQDRTIGVLVTQTYDEGVRFGDEELNILSFVSNQVAMAIERKMAEAYRIESEARLRRITDNMLDLISETDATGIIRYASPSHNVVLGYHPNELVGQPILNFIHVEDRDMFVHKLSPDGESASIGRIEFRFQHAGGSYVTMEVESTWLYDEEENLIGAVHGSRDITDRKRAEAALRENEERYRNLVEYQGEGICILDPNYRFLFANAAGERIFGVEPDCLTGRNLHEFVDTESREVLGREAAERLSQEPRCFEIAILRRDGAKRNLLITASPWWGSTNEYIGSFAVFRDISERKQVEEKLEFLSMHDVITGLHNRAYFEEQMARQECEQRYPVSIVYADMNGLKQTNDTLGHAAGDELLRQTAVILRSSFRVDDVIARLGGDEFGVLLPGADAYAAEQAVKRLRSNIASYNQQNPHFLVSLSIGVATSSPGLSMHSVLDLADRHMYADKAARVRF